MPRGPMYQPLLPYRPERDVYRLLGVNPTASAEEVTAACRRLARAFHPDRNASARATAEMQVVNAVRQVMGDPKARAQYDRERFRFHARAARPPQPHAGARVPLNVVPAEEGQSAVARYVRAVLIGVRTVMKGLAPARCRGCRTVISGEDAYCAACGTPLLTGG